MAPQPVGVTHPLGLCWDNFLTRNDRAVESVSQPISGDQLSVSRRRSNPQFKPQHLICIIWSWPKTKEMVLGHCTSQPKKKNEKADK